MKILFLALFAGLVSAQDNAGHPEISGVVIEPGSEHGVPDADITIFVDGARPANVTTDLQGKFRFQPAGLGHYRVVASKEGYGGEDGIDVTLSADHPTREVRFQLVRTGELTGRIVDEETGEPLVNYKIEVESFSYLNGRPRLGNPTLAHTDDGGRFAVSDLVPGRYVVSVGPRMHPLQSLDEDVRTDYEESIWPGGRVISGISTDGGAIKLRKVPLYAVRVAISDANCAAEERVHISSPIPADGSCGQTSSLGKLPPGSYSVELSQGKTPDHFTANVRFEVIDKDVDLTASLVRDIPIDSRVVAAEGAKIPFDKLRIWFVGPAGASAQPDSDGRFQLFGLAPFGKFSISLIMPFSDPSLSNHSYYIKEVRFNGEVAADNSIDLTGSLGPQSLEIIVDDKVATVTGVVNDGDHPVSKPFVVLSKWPLAPNLTLGSPPEKVIGDDDGQFRFAGLAPDEYRVIAVSQTNRDMLDEPGALQRVMNRAEKLTVKRGEVQTLILKLTDPSR